MIDRRGFTLLELLIALALCRRARRHGGARLSAPAERLAARRRGAAGRDGSQAGAGARHAERRRRTGCASPSPGRSYQHERRRARAPTSRSRRRPSCRRRGDRRLHGGRRRHQLPAARSRRRLRHHQRCATATATERSRGRRHRRPAAGAVMIAGAARLHPDRAAGRGAPSSRRSPPRWRRRWCRRSRRAPAAPAGCAPPSSPRNGSSACAPAIAARTPAPLGEFTRAWRSGAGATWRPDSSASTSRSTWEDRGTQRFVLSALARAGAMTRRARRLLAGRAAGRHRPPRPSSGSSCTSSARAMLRGVRVLEVASEAQEAARLGVQLIVADAREAGFSPDGPLPDGVRRGGGATCSPSRATSTATATSTTPTSASPTSTPPIGTRLLRAQGDAPPSRCSTTCADDGLVLQLPGRRRLAAAGRRRRARRRPSARCIRRVTVRLAIAVPAPRSRLFAAAARRAGRGWRLLRNGRRDVTWAPAGAAGPAVRSRKVPPVARRRREGSAACAGRSPRTAVVHGEHGHALITTMIAAACLAAARPPSPPCRRGSTRSFSTTRAPALETFAVAESGLEHALADFTADPRFERLLAGPDRQAGTGDDGEYPFRHGAARRSFPSAPFRYQVRVVGAVADRARDPARGSGPIERQRASSWPPCMRSALPFVPGALALARRDVDDDARAPRFALQRRRRRDPTTPACRPWPSTEPRRPPRWQRRLPPDAACAPGRPRRQPSIAGASLPSAEAAGGRRRPARRGARRSPARRTARSVTGCSSARAALRLSDVVGQRRPDRRSVHSSWRDVDVLGPDRRPRRRARRPRQRRRASTARVMVGIAGARRARCAAAGSVGYDARVIARHRRAPSPACCRARRASPAGARSPRRGCDAVRSAQPTGASHGGCLGDTACETMRESPMQCDLTRDTFTPVGVDEIRSAGRVQEDEDDR